MNFEERNQECSHKDQDGSYRVQRFCLEEEANDSLAPKLIENLGYILREQSNDKGPNKTVEQGYTPTVTARRLRTAVQASRHEQILKALLA